MVLAAVLFEQYREEMTILKEKNHNLLVNNPITEIITSFEKILLKKTMVRRAQLHFIRYD